MSSFATVAVGIALDRQFSYAVPDAIQGRIAVGMRVLVPFGPRLTTGYVTGLTDSTAYKGRLKPVEDLLDDKPTFTLHLLDFLRWAAAYYQVPLGELMRKALPPSMHTAEKARVVLTQAGRDRPADHPLLEKMAGNRPISLKRAMEVASRAEVDRLETQGLIEVVTAVEQAGPGAVYSRRVRINLMDDALITGPKQRELVDYVWENRVVDYDELKVNFKGASRLVSLLEERGVLAIERVRAFRQPDWSLLPPPRPETLNSAQEAAIRRLNEAQEAGSFAPVLLHGVTGSGKTEVYLRAIERTLALGRTALVLVPEIALTPQLMAAFESRFANRVAILHSALGRGERYDQWCQVADGSLPIVLGARSAIFAPLADIGLIVVDEEHEPSFKQDERPFYSARDLALVRGRMSNAAVVLGSATPALESYHNAGQGKLELLQLPDRATPRPLPDVVVVDLRRAGFADDEKVLSKPLGKALADNLAAGNQTILFLNRKGFAAFLLCEMCGAVPRCPHCDISLTYYRRSEVLRCHYCQWARSVPTQCPTCGSGEGLKQVGYGTERVADSLERFLPGARIARLDSTVSSGRNLTRTLSLFKDGLLDILVGTQIVAKGHDFPGVTLVGVLLADLGLSFPDFRASERTFQLLTQVAGRAGRGTRPGAVYVQTYMPDHPALLHAQRHDFTGFAREELEQRRIRGYPPFSVVTLVRITGSDIEQVRETANGIQAALAQAAPRYSPDLLVIGPGMAPLAFIRNRYRMQIMLRAPTRPLMQRFLKGLLPTLHKEFGRRSSIRWDVDVDPVNLM